jgi:uncharacterized protein YkwD
MNVGKPGATRRPLGAGLGLLVLAVSMALTPARGVTAAGGLTPCLDEAQAQQAVAMLNALRAQGLPCDTAVTGPQEVSTPLSWERRLAATAHELASDLAVRDELSHIDSRQRALSARLISAGYPAQLAGENLAAGQSDFAQALQAWQRSPDHCATLMERQYSEVGLACVQRPGSRYERFWVADLGVPQTR